MRRQALNSSEAANRHDKGVIAGGQREVASRSPQRKRGTTKDTKGHESMRGGRCDRCRVASRVRRIGRRTLRITGTEPLSLRSAPRTPRSPVHPMVPLSCCLKRHSGSPGVRLPHRQDTRPQATAQLFDRAKFRAGESGQRKGRPFTRDTSGRGGIRSATRDDDRSESSLSDPLLCPCRTAHPSIAQILFVLSEAVLVLVLVLAGRDKGDDTPSFESSTRRVAPQHLPAGSDSSTVE